MNHYNRTILSTLVGGFLIAGLAVTGFAAEPDKKIKIALKSDDFEMVEADLSDLAVGEAETIVTENGQTIDLLRTADGVEVYIDGELQDTASAKHAKHVIRHKDIDVHCDAAGGDECVNEFTFSTDSDDVMFIASDEDGHAVHKTVEIKCVDDEPCEKMVWVSDGDEAELGDLHEAGDSHKVIKVRKHKDVND